MFNVSRALLTAVGTVFLATGIAIAQNAPSQPSGGGAPPPAQKQHHKCSQTPKGCHKNQNKAQKAPPQQSGGAPPQTY
jgi:hypothetical protein